MPKKTTHALTGIILLKKVKELGNLPKSEKARLCGYFTTNKDGTERANIMQFQAALLEAAGIDLDKRGEGKGRRGRDASYRTTVQSNGNLLIGKTYTQQMGLEPGDEFEIVLGRKHIKLYKIEAGEDIEDIDGELDE